MAGTDLDSGFFSFFFQEAQNAGDGRSGDIVLSWGVGVPFPAGKESSVHLFWDASFFFSD